MESKQAEVNFDYTILLVEDDVRLACLIKEYMQQHNINIVIEHRGDNAVQRILAEAPSFIPDLLILDIMLPGLDGLEVCKKIRSRFAGPILMLTARNDDIDQILGLELGADDYLIKPVQPRVLLAHIRALLRRWPPAPFSPLDEEEADASLVFGQLKLSNEAKEIWFMNEKIDATTHEFELLWLLASNAGKVLSRDDILGSMRGVGYDGMDRSVDMRISKLRKKLQDDPTNSFRIKTVWGKGYLFIKDAWD